jgi:anaerobic ribonucleoside-triphosphate reductase
MNEDLMLNNAERTECECWTRVMGYLRPTAQYNPGKKSEFEERVTFVESRCVSSSAGKKVA